MHLVQMDPKTLCDQSLNSDLFTFTNGGKWHHGALLQLESDIPYSCPPSAISRMPAVDMALAFRECRTQETYCIHPMMSTGSCREWIFPTGDMLIEACMCTESLNATLFWWYFMPSDGTCPKFSSVGSYMDPQKHTQVPQRAIDWMELHAYNMAVCMKPYWYLLGTCW